MTPSQYLDTIWNHNVCDVKRFRKVTLRHTQPQSLLVPEERDRFLRDYVSVVHFVAGGYGKVGFLRRYKDTEFIETSITVTVKEIDEAYS